MASLPQLGMELQKGLCATGALDGVTGMDGDKHAIWGETIGASQGEGNAPKNVVYRSNVP